jgi:hypothetical protein
MEAILQHPDTGVTGWRAALAFVVVFVFAIAAAGC